MKELRKVSQEELRGILELHKLWLESEEGKGTQADLRDADLSYCDLRNANLFYADLSYADLTNADLGNANLTSADLFYAELRYADLTNTNLSNTKLINAKLFYTKVDNMVGLVNIGNENKTVYYFYKEDRVICGCFDNTLEEFKKAVTKKYGEDYGSYSIAIEMFEKMKDMK